MVNFKKYFTVAEINLRNLVYNLRNIEKKVAPAEVMAVVKADAYGHGAVPVTKALVDAGVKFFAVARLAEALELRNAGIKEKILIFGSLFQDEIPSAIDNNIRITLASEEDVKRVSEVAIKKRKIVHVHINVDTGMGRVGFLYDKAVPFILKSIENNNLNVEGLYSHFATSDCRDKSYAYEQLKKFRLVLSQLKKKKVKIPLIHMANSGDVLDIPESYFNMVRVGISLYGHYPSTETLESIPLKQVMTLKSKVLQIRRLPRGTNVSYGCHFTTKKETSIAILPIGYADGIHRAFTNKGKVMIKGKLYPIVGTVTMDLIMVDIGDDPIKAGDEVIFWGNSSGGVVQATKLAKRIGTISYELCCSVSKRVPRVYI